MTLIACPWSRTIGQKISSALTAAYTLYMILIALIVWLLARDVRDMKHLAKPLKRKNIHLNNCLGGAALATTYI